MRIRLCIQKLVAIDLREGIDSTAPFASVQSSAVVGARRHAAAFRGAFEAMPLHPMDPQRDMTGCHESSETRNPKSSFRDKRPPGHSRATSIHQSPPWLAQTAWNESAGGISRHVKQLLNLMLRQFYGTSFFLDRRTNSMAACSHAPPHLVPYGYRISKKYWI